MLFNKTVNIDLSISPEEVAQIFSEMTDTEQAQFFNHVAEQSTRWDKPFEFQLASVERSIHLTLNGRAIMRKIGEAVEPIN